jgi:hypothetical protein
VVIFPPKLESGFIELAQHKNIASLAIHVKLPCKIYQNRHKLAMNSQTKLMWIGAAKKDLVAMPGDVQDVFGFALHLAQIGEKHDKASLHQSQR